MSKVRESKVKVKTCVGYFGTLVLLNQLAVVKKNNSVLK